MRHLSRTAFLVLATTILVPSWSGATPLLSNFGEPTLDATPISAENWAAQAFSTDGNSYVLSWIDVLLGNPLEDPSVVAEFHSDDGTGNVGAFLFNLQAGIIPGAPGPVRLSPTTTIDLDPNTSYWVVLGVETDGSFEWSFADGDGSTGPGSFGPTAVSGDGGSVWDVIRDNNPMKMEIEVEGATTPAPEPATALLLLAGLGAALARRRTA